MTHSVNDADAFLYFAYGSNLMPRQMALRTGCADAGLVCQLPDHRLVFNKRAARMPGLAFANVVPVVGDTVWGVGYRCSEAMLEAMDVHEGVSGGHYFRQAVTVRGPGGEPLAAVAYLAGADHVCEERQPHPAYARLILDGARHHGLPGAYLRSLAQRLALDEDAAAVGFQVPHV